MSDRRRYGGCRWMDVASPMSCKSRTTGPSRVLLEQCCFALLAWDRSDPMEGDLSRARLAIGVPRIQGTPFRKGLERHLKNVARLTPTLRNTSATGTAASTSFSAAAIFGPR